MNIRKMRAIRQDPSPRGFRTLGKFNLEVTPDVTVYNCSLVRAPDGRHMLYGPASTAGETLSVSPAARAGIVEMALAALGNEKHDAAAA